MNRDILSCSNVTNIDVLFLVRNGHKADNYGIGKQKITQVFAFVVLKPTQGPAFSCCSKAWPDSEESVVFAHCT